MLQMVNQGEVNHVEIKFRTHRTFQERGSSIYKQLSGMEFPQDILFDIPHGLAASILTDWLVLNDIPYLDCAYCSKEKRPQYLQLLASDQVVFRDNIPHYLHNTSWIIERNIGVSHFVLDSTYEKIPARQLRRWFEQRGKQIFTVQLMNGTAEFNSSMVVSVIQHCPDLPALSIGGDLADNCLKQIFSLKELRELSLPGSLTSTRKMTFHNIGCTKLRTILLGSCGRDQMLQAVANGCPELEGVSVCGSLAISNAAILEIMTKCRRITHVLISENAWVDDALVQGIVEQCASLIYIRLRACENITDAAIVAIASKFHGLIEVDISNNHDLSDVTLRAIAEHCPLLETLDLGGCDDCAFTDEGITAIATHCPRLHSINLDMLYNITDLSILALAEHCPRLLRYELYDLDVSDTALLGIAQFRPDIKYIGLQGCRDVGSEGLFALATKCTQLAMVTLPDNSFVVNDLVMKFWEHINPNIQFN